MSLMIESMESRVLLSASVSVLEADFRSGSAAITAAKANLKSAVKEAALDVKGFKTDIKGLKLTATQKSALTALEKAEASDVLKATVTISKILATGTLRGAQLELALKSLVAHPAKVAIQLKVDNALTKLESVFSSTVISTVETQVDGYVSALDADLAAVATAIPSTQTTVNTTTSDLAADEITLSTDATTIANAITTLATDLA